MNFPSQRLADIEDNGKVVPVVERHAEGESCPARPRLRQGTIIARVFGRALDQHGKPVTDTVRQENYVEDRFNVPVAMRYGMIGTPVAVDEAGGTDVAQEIPYEARRMLTEAFGPTFLVFYDKVQKDLQVSNEQKQKLQRRLPDTVQDAVRFFDKLGDKKAEEQEKERRLYRQQAQEHLAAFLKETLKDGQLKRLRQLELQ